ncbi:MAG: hypothetical protein JXR82_10430, partial [Marinifilaceae bacterium]|nr:hypothetical protein [Marinifilaceae bacterium]
YWSEEDCFISTEYLFQEHHSSGDWASSNGGNYSTNSPYGGGSSGSSNSNLKDPEPYPGYNPAPPVVEDDSWKGTKADCIYDKIKNETSVLQNLLKEFMPSDSKFTLVFDIGYIPMDMSTGIPRQVNGKTYGTRSTNNQYADPFYYNIIQIRINENILAKSNLLMCNTILHEIIHAEIYKTVEESTKENGKVNPTILSESYPDLINDYQRINNFGEAQHIYMINQMHEKMVSILKWFDKSNHTQKEYEALAWLGLDKNTIFKSKFNETQIARINELQKKLSDEKDNCN